MSKSAIVTGGATGIGYAVAQALLERDYAVTIAGRRSEVLLAAAETLRAGAPGSRVGSVTADVANPADIVRLFDTHESEFGPVTALVTAAAFYEPVHALEMSVEAWDSTMNSALRGSVFAAQQAGRRMKAAGGGRIVLFSSINGFHSEPDSIHYSAAKAAIMSVAKSFAVDLAGTGVITNAVAPGWVYTPMTAEFVDETTYEQLKKVNTLGRAGRPEEIASVVRYLVCDAPEFLVGTTIFVDGGQTALAPMP
jgi:NAD(P)-dependent dehydrogenase (short-subunit alcohol dehydrogenase family)